MTEVVIPLHPATNNNFLELRFALRSIALFIEEPHITLIGAKPSWVRNINHIPATDSPDVIFRERNIFRKLLLSPYEDFLYFNDDHFLLQPWQDIAWYDKKLYQRLLTCVRGSIYIKTVGNTMRLYPKAYFFDIHCPMRINLSLLKDCGRINWDIPYGYAMKTIYASRHSIEGQQYSDLKIRQPIINLHEVVKDRLFFSSADNIWGDRCMIDQLKQLYPTKSPWE